MLIKARVESAATVSEIGPWFIMNAWDDQVTPTRQCLDFYSSLLDAGIRAELHIYNRGSHGYDLGVGRGASTALWPVSFLAWLQDSGFIED